MRIKYDFVDNIKPGMIVVAEHPYGKDSNWKDLDLPHRVERVGNPCTWTGLDRQYRTVYFKEAHLMGSGFCAKYFKIVENEDKV